MMIAEYRSNAGCPQKDSAERERYAGARSVLARETRERGGEPEMAQVLNRENLNLAFKKVKENKGAPGVDGLTIEQTEAWIRENRVEFVESVRNGKYKPLPLRRKGIPKPDGGVRNLGIPSVIDRTLQQAVCQIIMPKLDPNFSDSSYGYRPGRSAHDAMRKVREYANEGYTWVASIDLSKYFDTINHDRLLRLLRQVIEDESVVQLIKKFLKSGVMIDGVVLPTEEGSGQGGPLSPLLANLYLDEFDKTMEQRGNKFVRYADDIIIMCKSKRAAQRQLANAKKLLEGKLKLKLNDEKSKVVSVYSAKDFKYLGFAMGKNKNGAYIRAHPKSLKKAKLHLKELTKRNQGKSVDAVMQKENQFIRGWMGYFALANIKSTLQEWDGWRRRRYRAYIWKQWKKPKGRYKALRKLGIDERRAMIAANSRKSYWRMASSPTLNDAISNARLAQKGFLSMENCYDDARSRWGNRRIPDGTYGGVGGRPAN